MGKLYRKSGVLNPVSEKIGQMNFDGNITPHTWYLSPKLQNDKGKPNLVAITLLADIIYWYRPTLIRDEHTGAVTGTRQKFDADKLQRHYEIWGRTFGLTKRQVEDVMAFLKSRGLITVETRAVVTSRGVLPHCAFIEPVFEAIFEITFPSPEKTGDTSRKSGTRTPEKREHTYTTTETSPETSPENPPPPVPPAATAGEEEEDVNASRVEGMMQQIATITATSTELEKLRPLVLECVKREHKDAWRHTLTVMQKSMAGDNPPIIPNRFANTVLANALKSPVPPAAKRQSAPPENASPSFNAASAPPAETQGDAPAPWAYKQACKWLSGEGAAAFKAQNGRISEHDDWVAHARELEAQAALELEGQAALKPQESECVQEGAST